MRQQAMSIEFALAALVLISIAARLPAGQPGDTELEREAPVFGRADSSTSELKPVLERFAADRSSLERFHDTPMSPQGAQRIREFFVTWRRSLEKIDFEALGQDGRVDYILFANRLHYELRQLEHRGRRDEEIHPLVPFWKPIVDLLESRRRLESIDAEKVAEQLAILSRRIAEVREQLEADLHAAGRDAAVERPQKSVANRAARRLDDLRAALKDWYAFYNGYDPHFTWWVRKPYEQLDSALDEYASDVRKRLVTPASGEDDAIVGDPIGRDALLTELAYEMVPYSPEELVDIAEREFAWCDRELVRASRELGFGDDWRRALEHVKTLHVAPGEQPELIRRLAREAEEFLDRHDLVTIPDLCRRTWRMEMMSPRRQRVNPYFTGGETISVSYPTDDMTHEEKLMSMRGNNIHFARATVHHELIPGHHLQGFMTRRYRSYRRMFRTPFWIEGWALYWEMLLWDLDFPETPENRVGMLFWRMHRCARIIFSLSFHLGKMTPQEAIDFLVQRVGHERRNATAEVRRSVSGAYGPLYQCAYMLGGLQIHRLRRDLVESGRMTNREFHDAVLRQNAIPIEMVRAALTGQTLTRDFESSWRFYDESASGEEAAVRPRHGRGTKEDYERASNFAAMTRGKVFKAEVRAHWFDDDTKLWYRNDVRGEREFILVDATRGERTSAFDHVKLAAGLSTAVGQSFEAKRLPLEAIEFAAGGRSVEFDVASSRWSCELKNYECRRIGDARPRPPAPERRRRFRERRRRGGDGPVASPDGRWTAFVREHDVYLKERDTANEHRLTDDGTEGLFYSPDVSWSPDSGKLVTYRVKPGEERRVHYIETSPASQLQPKYSSIVYAKPGDVLTIRKPVLFDVTTRARIDVSDALFPEPFWNRRLRWRRDSSAFTFEYNQRGHQVYRVIEVDARTGVARALISEESDTFVDYNHKNFRYDVDDGKEIIWASERDGWNHLYLHDGESGEVKHQITSGPWVVRGVERVDEQSRQIWFRASGRNRDQDPYQVHYYRVGFDGTGLVALTEGDGTHSIRFSPNRKYIVDTYSRADVAPVSELRRVSDGSLVCVLETADVDDLLAIGWRWPEPFHAKGRDGTVDIYGVIYRPMGFDPTKKYPVIESIYAGPQSSYVPKSFRDARSQQALAELGFIVVQIDGMGTSNRSRVFHHFCHKNLGDAGLPDRIAWMRAAAANYPYMDLERVGVYGHSAGGQNAAGALFGYPDFYKVAVASCGCHDNRMDKIWWNEMWMGYPIGPHYEEQSNVTNAHKLEGNLLLIVGEMDKNVDPASTMQVVNALIKANKDFDLLVLPGQGHTDGGAYGRRRTWDFFVRHLHGVEPRRDQEALAGDRPHGVPTLVERAAPERRPSRTF